MDRNHALISKELDGDISHSEAVELERAEWTNPDLRRARQAWQRATRAIAQVEDEGAPIPVERWAAQVARASRPTLIARVMRLFDDTRRHPWTVGACGLATTAVLLVAVWPSAPVAPSAPTAVWQPRPMPPPAPVEVRVEGAGEEGDDAPVSIRF